MCVKKIQQVITDKEHLRPTKCNQLILIKNRQNTKTYGNRFINLDLIRYLHAMLLMTHQDMIYTIRAKKIPAEFTYKVFQRLELNIKLPTNQYMNWNSIHIYLRIKIKSKAVVANNIAANMMTVNNFFVLWIKEINIKRYGDDLEIVLTNNVTDIYRYLDAVLKHMPKNALKTFAKTLLYSKKKDILSGTH